MPPTSAFLQRRPERAVLVDAAARGGAFLHNHQNGRVDGILRECRHGSVTSYPRTWPWGLFVFLVVFFTNTRYRLAGGRWCGQTYSSNACEDDVEAIALAPVDGLARRRLSISVTKLFPVLMGEGHRTHHRCDRERQLMIKLLITGHSLDANLSPGRSARAELETRPRDELETLDTAAGLAAVFSVLLRSPLGKEGFSMARCDSS